MRRREALSHKVALLPSSFLVKRYPVILACLAKQRKAPPASSPATITKLLDSMKQVKTLLVLSGVLISGIAFGQTSKKYEKYLEKRNYQLGYIETVDGRRIEGLVKDISGFREYAKVVFVSEEGVKKAYYPYQLKAYGTKQEQYESNLHHFLRVVDEANGIGLYKRSVNERKPSSDYSSPATYDSFANVYYVKRSGEEEFLEVRRRRFAETFSGYFADCPKLQEKIQKEAITEQQAEEMVRIYRDACHEQEMKYLSDRF